MKKKINFRNKNYSYIFHFAATIGVSNVINNPWEVLNNNFLATKNIIEFAQKQKKLKKFFFASTSEIYAGSLSAGLLKFPTKEKWVNGFLKKTIENCYYGLKKNGYMIYNISNTPKYKFIEEETIKIAKSLGFVQEKTIQLTLSSVMGAGHKYEPIFVFKKKNN